MFPTKEKTLNWATHDGSCHPKYEIDTQLSPQGQSVSRFDVQDKLPVPVVSGTPRDQQKSTSEEPYKIISIISKGNENYIRVTMNWKYLPEVQRVISDANHRVIRIEQVYVVLPKELFAGSNIEEDQCCKQIKSSVRYPTYRQLYTHPMLDEFITPKIETEILLWQRSVRILSTIQKMNPAVTTLTNNGNQNNI